MHSIKYSFYITSGTVQETKCAECLKPFQILRNVQKSISAERIESRDAIEKSLKNFECLLVTSVVESSKKNGSKNVHLLL